MTVDNSSLPFRKQNRICPFQECPVSQSLTFGVGHPAPRVLVTGPLPGSGRSPVHPRPLGLKCRPKAHVSAGSLFSRPRLRLAFALKFSSEKTALETDGNWAPGDGSRPIKCHEANNVIDAVYRHSSVTNYSRRRSPGPLKAPPRRAVPRPAQHASTAQVAGGPGHALWVPCTRLWTCFTPSCDQSKRMLHWVTLTFGGPCAILSLGTGRHGVITVQVFKTLSTVTQSQLRGHGLSGDYRNWWQESEPPSSASPTSPYHRTPRSAGE